MQAKQHRGQAVVHPFGVRCQQAGARLRALHQHHVHHVARYGFRGGAHLGSAGEEHQRAALHLLQVVHQRAHHFGGVGIGVLGVGTGVHHRQAALLGVVEGAGHLQCRDIGLVGQAGFFQKVVKAAAAGERRAGDDGAAHLAPQKLPQQVAGHDGAGVRGHGEKAVFALGLQPLGQGLVAMLQQQIGGTHQAAQARRQAAQLRIQLRAQHRLAGVVFGDGLHIHAQRFQGLGQAGGLRLDLAHRLVQGLGQHAIGKTQGAVFAAPVGILAGVGPHQVHGHAGDGGEGAFELAGHGLHVFAEVQGQFAGHVVHRFGQFVQPAQVGEVHAVGKLVQGHGGQVVAFVKHHQAVVQVRQGFHAQAGQHEVVVGHDDLALCELGTCVVVAALFVARAVAGGAGVALSGYGRPVSRIR